MADRDDNPKHLLRTDIVAPETLKELTRESEPGTVPIANVARRWLYDQVGGVAIDQLANASRPGQASERPASDPSRTTDHFGIPASRGADPTVPARDLEADAPLAPGTEFPDVTRYSIPLRDVAFLVSITPVAGVLVLLPPNEKVFFGRTPEPAVRKILLEHTITSRRQCFIERHSGGYVLTDCGSVNGTFVNGARVTSFPLQTGDEIQVPPHYRFLFISHIRTGKPPLVNIKELRRELAEMLPSPPQVRILMSDAGIPRGSVPDGPAEHMWNDALDLLLRQKNYATLARLLEEVLEAGYRSEVVSRAAARLRGITDPPTTP